MLREIASPTKYSCHGDHEKRKLIRRVDGYGLGIWYDCPAGDYSVLEPSELCKKVWREQGWSENGEQANTRLQADGLTPSAKPKSRRNTPAAKA